MSKRELIDIQTPNKDVVGLVHLQLGKAERHVDPGTKGSTAYH